MTVVADAGPLMALAKVGGLDALFRLYPRVLIPTAVYEEAIEAGRDGALPDALALEACCQADQLEVSQPPNRPMSVPGRLGRGETETILLAVQQGAKWALVDDLAARQAAEATFRAEKVPTQVKGTLGVIVSAFRGGHLSADEAVELVSEISKRPDIWVHERLCMRVVEVLKREAR